MGGGCLPGINQSYIEKTDILCIRELLAYL